MSDKMKETLINLYTILRIIGIVTIAVLSIAITYLTIEEHEKRISKLELEKVELEQRININRDFMRATDFNVRSIAKKIGADYIMVEGEK